MKRITAIILSLSCMILLTACAGSSEVDDIHEGSQMEDTISENEHSQEDPPSQEDSEEPEPEIDLSVIQPNEAGEIMVLMYHHIKEPEAEWSRTPDNLKGDLQFLYEKGYRPISLEDYANGNITTAAGLTPVVLTFDDGNQNNFNMIQDEKGEWVIDPDSAVGILVAFHEKHPDFPLEATFFINGGIPFGQKELVDFKLNYLVEKGMDIGNHTKTHVNFTNAGKEVIREEIGSLVQLVKEYAPNYDVKTLALPFGSKPKDTSLFQHIVADQWQDISYENIAILEVGWDPYHSPYHQSFNANKIRRVRASETKVEGVGLYDWLKAFEEGRRTRYISDGKPETVTVPEKYRDQVRDTIEGREVKTYSLE